MRPIVIEMQSFRKSYGNKLVHRDVSFQVEKGECLGLLGGSGIGKSVILRSLIGLEKADGGKILIQGEDIANYNEQQLIPIRKKVAYAFQGGALFDSMSVYENLAYPLREHSQASEEEIATKIAATLEQLHMPGTEALYPGDLSGGMQKRIGLARALILGPEVILYDEPTAGLDPFNTIRIQEIILELKQTGVSSILVTHDIPTAARVCDRAVILADGIVQTHVSRQEMEQGSNDKYRQFIEGELR